MRVELKGLEYLLERERLVRMMLEETLQQFGDLLLSHSFSAFLLSHRLRIFSFYGAKIQKKARNGARKVKKLIATLRILGEPALFHTFLLMEKFADAPKCRGTKHAHDGRNDGILDKQCRHQGCHTYQQIDDPRAGAPIILGLDDDRVPDADGQERADSYDNTSKIHFRADYLFILVRKGSNNPSNFIN